jgi:hypothetical protein
MMRGLNEQRNQAAFSRAATPFQVFRKIGKLWIVFPWPVVVILLSSWNVGAQSLGGSGSGEKTPLTGSSAGERIARQVCAACHLFPEPDVTDQKTWKEQILPRMETRLGVSPPDYRKNPEGELLKRLKLYPDEPLISKADWEAIVDYYMTRAPATAPPQDARPEIQVALKQFITSPARFRYAPPLTTLVKISPSSRRIFIGDDRAKALAIVSSTGELLDSIRVENVPISVVETEQGIYVTAIGSFQPSEVQKGALFFYEKKGDKFGSRKVVLKDLPRAVQTEFCDFNRDGKTDFAICLFGDQRGRFSWFENVGNDDYKEHVLIEKAGAIHCVARDFNNDGIPDIGVLMAQESEAFYIFTNDGKGNLSSQLVFQKQPAFGHNYFELADFDGDGRMDLLVVNGDNGEYQSSLKKYQGVRIYLSRGTNRFEEAYFFPLNGATKAVARDFDGDGDLDIAIISFYPDYLKSPRESFVYLENRGGLSFSPSTFRECISGRWVVMDVGDVDGDGDLDIVLGSYIRGPTAVPEFLSRTWEKQGPSLMILKNKRR